MFFNANVTWQRGSAILQQHIPADIQDMDVPEAKDLQAQSPAEAFWIFTDPLYDIKKGDFLIKEEDTTEVYRVFARVRKYSEHLEIPAELLSDDEREQFFAKEKPLEEEKNTSQSNSAKGSGSILSKARSFESLIGNLLQNLGYRVVSHPRMGDAEADFLAYRTVTSPSGVASEETWIVEVKYRNLAPISIDILYRLAALTQEIKGSKALLVLNSALTKSAKNYASKRNGLEIWDAEKLTVLLNPFPELKLKYSELLPQSGNTLNEEMLSESKFDTEHELIKELKNLPTGDGKPYEELVKRILDFCFRDEFSPFAVKDQVHTSNERRIRDFIIDNRSPKQLFWQDLKHVRKVEKILFDAKNYKDAVKYREIQDTLRYLKNEAFGNFIIIISRQGLKDYEEILEDYLKSQQVVLSLCDNDLIDMIKLKLNGASPTPLIDDRYYEFLDKV